MPSEPLPVRALGPQLLPGALLVRRDPRHLQVGTDPGVVVRDRPGLARILRLLDGALPYAQLSHVVSRDVPEFTDDLDQTLARLVAAGVVLAPSPPPVPRVAVRHDRSTAHFASLIRAGTGPSALEPDLEVVVSAGEPARTPFEVLLSAGVPHLPVVLTERRVRLGPLVLPALAPCLGCLDALLASYDPAWRALAPQFERPRLLPVAMPPQLLLRAAAEVVHQIESLMRGAHPSTVGHVLSLGPEHDELDLRAVPFSPSCPCGLLAA